LPFAGKKRQINLLRRPLDRNANITDSVRCHAAKLKRFRLTNGTRSVLFSCWTGVQKLSEWRIMAAIRHAGNSTGPPSAHHP